MQDPAPAQTPQVHNLIEDAQGILYGAGVAAFDMTILTHLGMITGQTAGLAVMLSYLTGHSFGLTFFLINLPFCWLGYRRFGPAFRLKTFVALPLLSGLSLAFPTWVGFQTLHPVIGALVFGAFSGSALIALFRHRASLGGVGILALILQDRTGFRAGYAQLLIDVALFSAALWILPLSCVVLSALGALVVNLTITINHRRDRYIAT